MSNIRTLSKDILIIDGAIYRVEDYPGDVDDLVKGIAYRFDTTIHNYILPFMGKLKASTKSELAELPPGIYTKKHSPYPTLIFPKTNRKNYSIGNIKDTSAVDPFNSVKFIKPTIDLGVDGDIFVPNLHPDDDFNNKLIKIGIRMKGIPIKAYGPRFATMDAGSSAANRTSNAIKALKDNSSMSATKLEQFSGPLDLNIALIISNTSNAIHPMPFESIVIFPKEKFDIKGAVDVDDIKDYWVDDSKLTKADDSKGEIE